MAARRIVAGKRDASSSLRRSAAFFFLILQADRVDAVAATVPTHKDILAKADDPGLEIAHPFTQPMVEGQPAGLCGALGFRKEDAAFLRKFNRSLEAFIGSERHLAIVRPFGFGEQNMPGGHTTEQLCRPLPR